MKRKVFITILIAFVVVSLAALFFILNNRDSDEESSTASSSEEHYISYTHFPVNRGPMTSTYAFSTTATADADAVKTLYLSLSDELIAKRGANVKKGEALYKSGADTVNAEHSMKVLNITRDETVGRQIVEYLDYESVKLVARLPFSMYGIVDYNAHITLNSDVDNVPLNIDEIGYTVENDQFTVVLSSKEMFLPGERIDCTLRRGIRENVLHIPAEAVYNDGTSYYVTMFDENRQPYRCEILVGELFKVNQSGNIWYYYEVLGGIKEGQDAVVQGFGGEEDDEFAQGE